jgi:4'-phosphopantetheinyl transferase
MTSGNCPWESPPETVVPSRDEVHVWCLSLTPKAPVLDRLRRILSADEIARADRFYFERDRTRFIAARGQLRTILARYLRVDPEIITFCYGARGKPFLDREAAPADLKFNLSHSGDLGLVGVTVGREIGVDIELMREMQDAEQIAKRFFSPIENKVFRSFPQTKRLEAFFACWTTKEAYIKATGDGLWRPTESFDVSFEPSVPARLIAVEGDLEEASRWTLKALEPAPGYVGAVAVEGTGWSISCWWLEPG